MEAGEFVFPQPPFLFITVYVHLCSLLLNNIKVMGIVIGIDVGGSTTKIVGIEDNAIKSPMFVKATDPVTSLFGAFGKYIYDNNISLSNIEKVILTGVGSAYIDQPLYGLPTAKTDEFLANGLGASYNTGLDNLLVASMGTGTSFVRVRGTEVVHIGGLGIGGGTILGLSRLLLKTHDFHHITSLAEHGSLDDVDLHIRDITPHPLPGLPLDVTASIFGKIDANAKVEDIALGIVHMVLQTIGQGAIFASMNDEIKNVVLIGNLTRLPQSPRIFSRLEEMCDVHFLIPEYAEYRTAIGAALSYIDNREYRNIE